MKYKKKKNHSLLLKWLHSIAYLPSWLWSSIIRCLWKKKKQNVKIEIFLSLCFYSTFDLRTCIFSQLKLRPIQWLQQSQSTQQLEWWCSCSLLHLQVEFKCEANRLCKCGHILTTIVIQFGEEGKKIHRTSLTLYIKR